MKDQELRNTSKAKRRQLEDYKQGTKTKVFKLNLKVKMQWLTTIEELVKLPKKRQKLRDLSRSKLLKIKLSTKRN